MESEYTLLGNMCACVKQLATVHHMDRDTLIGQLDLALDECPEPGKPVKVHTFRIVWEREWSDDHEYIEKEMQKQQEQHLRVSIANAAIAQLRGEVDDNPKYKGRLRFSDAVIFYGAMYYILSEVDFEHPGDERTAMNAFMADFQPTFDEYGAAGHYQFVKEGRTMDSDDNWPVPPWRRQRVFLVIPQEGAPEPMFHVCVTDAEGSLDDIYAQDLHEEVDYFATKAKAKQYIKNNYGCEPAGEV